MKRNATSSIGALHPVFFMLLIYIVSIVLAFFVCRVIYFSLHAERASTKAKVENLSAFTAAK